MERINKDADKILLTLLFFGSGVSYYAFERFSMTHVYEVFISSLIIYLSTNYYSGVVDHLFLRWMAIHEDQAGLRRCTLDQSASGRASRATRLGSESQQGF